MTDLGLESDPLIRPKHRLLRVLACMAVLVSLVAWGMTRLFADFGKAADAAAGAMAGVLVESGGLDAAQASNVARAQGTAVGSLTVAEVQRQVPSVRWVAATVVSTNINEASLAVAGDQVTTATELFAGQCSYGLAVESADAPVVAADGLPGSGVFVNLPIPQVPAVPCAAADAPTSGWTRVSSADLSDAGIAVYPVSG
jgi:hypothetical protein